MFLARDFGTQTRNYSEAVAAQIDQEIHDALTKAYQRAYDLLSENREKLDGLAQLLTEKETIGRAEFVAFMKGETLCAEAAKSEEVQESVDVSAEEA